MLLVVVMAGSGACSTATCDGACGGGKRCVDGRCRLPCLIDDDCGEHEVCYREYCEQGDRRPDGGRDDGGGTDDGGGATDDGGGGDADGADGDASSAVCGNNTVEGGETCDGTDLGVATTCGDLYFGSGPISCFVTCTEYDLSACSGPAGSCNGGGASGREQCDGTDLRLETCESFGFGGGVLACNANCSFDVTGCIP